MGRGPALCAGGIFRGTACPFRYSARWVSHSRLESLSAASEKIHDSFGDSRLPSSLDILHWPGVIETDAAVQTTRNALDLKVLIEQIREQVQNIE